MDFITQALNNHLADEERNKEHEEELELENGDREYDNLSTREEEF